MDLMRQLEAEHKTLWDGISPQKPVVNIENDCDPALLSGWTDRDLSLWDVTSNNGKPGLREILVAICRKKKNWDKITYLLFSKDAVSLAGLNLTQSNGNTGDQMVDTSGTHFEIKGITGKELCNLIFQVSKSNFSTGTFKKSEMESILLNIYDSTRRDPLIYGATSQKPSINIPSSGSGVRGEIATSVTKEELQKSLPPTEQIPFSPSSTS